MVFSTECKKVDKLGVGIFIPFKKELTIEEIITQGKPMIEAEHNRTVDFNRFNWGWGCLGIVTNSNLEKIGIEKLWASKFGNSFNQAEYKIGEESD